MRSKSRARSSASGWYSSATWSLRPAEATSSLRRHELVPAELPPRPAAAPALEAHVDGVRPRVERGPDGLGASGRRQEDGHGHPRHGRTRGAKYYVPSTIHRVE